MSEVGHGFHCRRLFLPLLFPLSSLTMVSLRFLLPFAVVLPLFARLLTHRNLSLPHLSVSQLIKKTKYYLITQMVYVHLYTNSRLC